MTIHGDPSWLVAMPLPEREPILELDQTAIDHQVESLVAELRSPGLHFDADIGAVVQLNITRPVRHYVRAAITQRSLDHWVYSRLSQKEVSRSTYGYGDVILNGVIQAIKEPVDG